MTENTISKFLQKIYTPTPTPAVVLYSLTAFAVCNYGCPLLALTCWAPVTMQLITWSTEAVSAKCHSRCHNNWVFIQISTGWISTPCLPVENPPPQSNSWYSSKHLQQSFSIQYSFKTHTTNMRATGNADNTSRNDKARKRYDKRPTNEFL